MEKYSSEIQYQDTNGNPKVARYKIKATDIASAIDKAESRVRKLKNYSKTVGGDFVVLTSAAA